MGCDTAGMYLDGWTGWGGDGGCGYRRLVEFDGGGWEGRGAFGETVGILDGVAIAGEGVPSCRVG